MRTCLACGLAQEHSYPYCKKCGAALERAVTAASPPANAVHVCPSCGLEQSHAYPFCKKCGSAISGAPASETLPPPRCPSCGALKDPDWRVCEHCGSGATRQAPPYSRLLWIGLAAFTALWVAGLVAWWNFSYHLSFGPLIAGSAIEIDGKTVATYPNGAAEYSAPLSRGQHTLVTRAPGHLRTEGVLHIGWTGLSRRFILTQLPEIACVNVAGPPEPTVSVGARLSGHFVSGQFCAPVGTRAVAEWRPDVTQSPLRQDFQYNDGEVVELPNAAAAVPDTQSVLSPSVAPPAQPPLSPSPNAEASRQRAEQLVQVARVLFARRQYRSALVSCDLALRFDPGNQEALRLQMQVRKTMQILGIQN